MERIITDEQAIKTFEKVIPLLERLSEIVNESGTGLWVTVGNDYASCSMLGTDYELNRYGTQYKMRKEIPIGDAYERLPDGELLNAI